MMTLRWKTKPLCERCYINHENPIAYGQVATIVKAPPQLDSGVRKVESCSECGDTTIVGIYVRRQVDDGVSDDEVSEGGVILHPRAELELGA